MNLIITVIVAVIVLVLAIILDIYWISKLDEKIIKTVWLTLGVIATLNYMFVRYELIEHVAPIIVAYSIFKLYRK